MFLAIFLSLLAYAGSPAQEVVATFNKSQIIYEKFQSDTVKYRQEAESFNENDFIPAGDKMIGLLKEKKCQKCLQPYLKGLSRLNNSASEELLKQLKEIISNYSEPLNRACGHIDTKTKKTLTVLFKDGVALLSDEMKISKVEIEKKILECVKL